MKISNQPLSFKENATLLISFKKTLPEQGNFIVVFKGKHCEKTVDAKKVNDFTLLVETPSMLLEFDLC